MRRAITVLVTASLMVVGAASFVRAGNLDQTIRVGAEEFRRQGWEPVTEGGTCDWLTEPGPGTDMISFCRDARAFVTYRFVLPVGAELVGYGVQHADGGIVECRNVRIHVNVVLRDAGRPVVRLKFSHGGIGASDCYLGGARVHFVNFGREG